MKNERIEYLDGLKGISILLVVFCHYVLLSKETIVGNYIMALSWSAVPCFMMTSGALMHQSSFAWKKYFIKIGKIYGSLCIWRLIYLIVFFQLKELHFGKIQFLQYLFLLTDLEGVNTGVMWYMIAFLLVLLIYPFTHFLFQDKTKRAVSGHKILLFVAVVAALGGILIPSANWCFRQFCGLLQITHISLNGISRMLPFTNYANMIFYFILGAFLFEYQSFIDKKIRRFRAVLLPVVLASAGGLLFVKFAETKSFAWEGVYLSEGYHHVLTFLMAAGMFLFFMEYQKELHHSIHVLAVFIGRYTMGIYYLHYILLAVCSVLVYPKFLNYYSCGLNCLKTVIVTAVCVIATVLLRRVPFIKGLVK